MSSKDIYQAIGSLEPESVRRLVDRLEYRGKDEAFARMRDEYLARLELSPDARVLDAGCGTGIVARSMASQGHSGPIVGIDSSADFIDAARRFAAEEGLGERVEFREGDAQSLDDRDESYDAILAHTVVSHAPNPVAIVSEAARVVRSGGPMCIFDGDYASLTLSTGDRELDVEIVRSILSTVVANPFVMRELPLMFRRFELDIVDCIASVRTEAGTVTFFSSLADTYIPITVSAGNISADRARKWLEGFHEASDKGTAFASCNYYAYIARRPPS